MNRVPNTTSYRFAAVTGKNISFPQSTWSAEANFGMDGGVHNLLRQLEANDLVPDSLMTGVQVGQVRFILTGVGLMLLMIFRPQGVFGDRREIAIDVRR